MRNYGNEIVKLLTIINNYKLPVEEHHIAIKRLKEIRFNVTKNQYGLPEDRVADVMELEDVINNPLTAPFVKVKAREAIDKIRKESTAIRDMRKSLIKEMRNRRVDNVRDITEFVQKRSKYKNE